jgi:hypothetical protein
VDEQSIAKAREELEKKMKELEAQPLSPAAAPAATPATKPAAKPAVATSEPEKVSKKPASPKVQQPLAPIQPPPPAVSGTKQQRLEELLRKYKADEITPEEYHQQRVKILSEP